jgi:dephospho-CoA kinase
MEKADFIIVNDKPINESLKEIEKIWMKILQKTSSKSN